jgi:hypothetical protein
MEGDLLLMGGGFRMSVRIGYVLFLFPLLMRDVLLTCE